MDSMNREMAGVLLAGGLSSRMGADKASLEVDGEPLARRMVDMLAGFCDEVLVASGDGRRLGWLGVRQVADVLPDAGPLAGLVPGLEAAGPRHALIAVVAVDMPYASPAVFRLLGELWGGEDAVVPVTDAGLEPLHAVYAPAAARPLRAELERGERSLRRGLRALSVREVGPDEWRDADPTGRFALNLNRPEDLAPR